MHDFRDGFIFPVHGHDKGKLKTIVKKSKSTFYSDSYFTASFSKDIAFTSLSWPNPSVIFNFIQKLMQV